MVPAGAPDVKISPQSSASANSAARLTQGDTTQQTGAISFGQPIVNIKSKPASYNAIIYGVSFIAGLIIYAKFIR